MKIHQVVHGSCLNEYWFFIFLLHFFRVEKLIENHDYKFRVRAVNRMGEGEPLNGSDIITARDPYSKPDKPGKPKCTGTTIPS